MKKESDTYRWIQGAAIALTVSLLLGSIGAEPAYPAEDGGNPPPARLERVPGDPIPRITLSVKAAERLGIETAEVSTQVVKTTQVVGGVVVPAMDSHLRPDRTETWIHVTLSQVEWARLARNRPARLLPLAVGSRFDDGIPAHPTGLDPIVDDNSAMLSLYYTLPPGSGLRPKDRVRVELQLSGSNESVKVIPYSAVYYDSNGDTWVYVNDEALVFKRQSIIVENISGDVVVLSDGPPTGTRVVTVGAALLYGTEIFGK